MIVNYQRKYIFVGLPFSASSVISKELLENYGGDPILSKHANIPFLLKKRPKLKICDFFVFAVFRNPIEIVFTQYNKLLTNAFNVFTDPRYFIENGGHVQPKGRKIYKLVHQYGWTFEEYVRHVYTSYPYDNDFSLNHKYLTFVARFDYLQQDFFSCLRYIGLSPKRSLSTVNKTRKVMNSYRLSENTTVKVFGPFLAKYSQYCKKFPDMQVSWYDKLRYEVFSKMRAKKRMWLDKKLYRNRNVKPGKYYE